MNYKNNSYLVVFALAFLTCAAFVNSAALRPTDSDDDDIHVVCAPPGPDGWVVFAPHPYNCSK